jgi:hypothetical protein
MASFIHERARALRALAMLATLATLGACASFRGSPEPVIDTKTIADANSQFLADPLAKFASPNDADRGGLTKRQWRDNVINAYVVMADRRYAEFKQALNEQDTGLNLGTDLVALGLTGAGAVAGKGAAQILSAASVGVIGAGAAFNKDVYYQKTLPALYAEMDADRKQVLVQIRTSQQSDEVAYPLGVALVDLGSYEAAGTIEAAIAQVTGTATVASANADAKLQTLFPVKVVDDSVQARKVNINKYVRALATDSSQKPTLDAICKLLNIPPDPVAKTERNSILLEMDKRVSDETSMDQLSALLKPVTKEDF